MNYLLDTNLVIAILKNKPAQARARLRRVAKANATVSISSIVLFELWYGVKRSGRLKENTERLRLFMSGAINIVPFEEADAMAAGDLRAELEGLGTPIGPYDLLIAAQALRIGATLVTANVSEFARVKGLKFQDWTI